MHYTCPVCGYRCLENPPEDHFMCPSCGTEFGYDDVGHSHTELRRLWIMLGANWFLPPEPPGWNPWQQLTRAGFGFDIPYRADFVTGDGASVEIIAPDVPEPRLMATYA